mgnify:CR=1 FL=1
MFNSGGYGDCKTIYLSDGVTLTLANSIFATADDTCALSLSGGTYADAGGNIAVATAPYARAQDVLLAVSGR